MRVRKTPLTKSSTARSPVVRDINVNQHLPLAKKPVQACNGVRWSKTKGLKGSGRQDDPREEKKDTQ